MWCLIGTYMPNTIGYDLNDSAIFHHTNV